MPYGRYWHSVSFDLPTQNATIANTVMFANELYCPQKLDSVPKLTTEMLAEKQRQVEERKQQVSKPCLFTSGAVIL